MTDIYRHFQKDFSTLCQEHREQELIIFDADAGHQVFSYGEAEVYCRRYLSFFKEHGLQSGDTVVGIMPNSPEAILCFFSCMLAGIHYAPAPCAISNREFDHWIALTKPKLIMKKATIADYATDVDVFECNCNGELSWLPEEETNWIEQIAPQVYLMTSGTTGTPKAMSINTDKLWSSGAAFAQHYHLEKSGIRFWNYLPMSYLGGLYNLALIPLFCGGSFVISEPFSGKAVLNFWNYVKKHHITALWLVPSIVRGLIKLSKLTGGKHISWIREQIQIAFLGTAPIQVEQKQLFEETFGFRMYENFALSESTFLTAESEDNIRYREQSSVGTVLPYVQMKFVPVEEESGISAIWIKTPFLFDGYLAADGTAELELDEDGYFNTKDLGALNEDQVLVLNGRSRDIIKKGGLFVSLTEIENAVNKLAFVEESAAVPIEHDFYGEAYVLCVNFKENALPEEQIEKLRMWMLENFVSYKVPEKIINYGEFPRTASGKVQKKQMAEKLQEGKNK